jgi:SNF2 family DNA or RNA helicase
LQPTKEESKKLQKQREAETRLLYKNVFGDNSDAKDENAIKEYQKELERHVFHNGGQLRDYQAEGVTWMMSNYINKRSSILADEMGKLPFFLTLLTYDVFPFLPTF